MDITLYHKFTQHLNLKQELLSTGDDILVEVSCYPADVRLSFTLQCRIRIKTRSGESAPTEVGEMNWDMR